MKVKEGEAHHSLKREAERSANKENKEGAHEKIEDSPITTAQDVEQLIDNLEALEAKTNCWDSPEFLELVGNEEFQDALDIACRRAIASFNASPIYSLGDLKYDVMDRFGKWLPAYRYEASFETVLGRIARNQLIDVHRRPNERCYHLEDLKLEGYNVDAMRSHDGAADIYNDILIRECLGKLKTHEERQLFIEHFVEGKRKSDIARELHISRQAVKKQLERMLQKLKPYV